MLKIATLSVIFLVFNALPGLAQSYDDNNYSGGQVHGYNNEGQYYYGNSSPGGAITMYDEKGRIQYGHMNSQGQGYLYGQ